MGPGSWIEDPPSWILDAGSSVQDPGSMIRVLESGITDPGHWIMDAGSSVLDPRCRDIWDQDWCRKVAEGFRRKKALGAHTRA